MKFLMLKKSPDQKTVGKHYGKVNPKTGERSILKPGTQIETDEDLCVKYPGKFQRLDTKPEQPEEEKKEEVKGGEKKTTGKK